MPSLVQLEYNSEPISIFNAYKYLSNSINCAGNTVIEHFHEL